MPASRLSVSVLCAVALLLRADPGAAQGTYSLDTGSGSQFQIGIVPVPIQQPFTMGSPIGTGTLFPPLLVPGTGATVFQTGTTAPLTLTVFAGAFQRTPSGPTAEGWAALNAALFQVSTHLSFVGEDATFMAGGRTGALTTTFGGVPGSATARYSKSAAQFGGPATTLVVAPSPVRFWTGDGMTTAPCKHPFFGGSDPGCVSEIIDAHPAPTVAAGQAVGFVNTWPGIPAMSPYAAYLSVPASTGLVASFLSFMGTGIRTDMATSAGLPWTTGMLTLSQPSALGGASIFTLTGSDARTPMGQGTLSLVAGALSDRTLSGPTANRAWQRYVLVPEPDAALGGGAALAALGLCYALMRRRLRRSPA